MKLVVFLGSPIRAHIIEHLLKHGMQVSAIFAPAGEKYQSIHEIINGCSIPTEIAKSPEIVEDRLRNLAPDIILSVGWPFVFKHELLNGPWLLLNSHPTLLPKYRGPSPWAYIIENGEKEAGVTVHKVDEGLDTGPILYQEKISLTSFDTYRSLRHKLIQLEPHVILEALRRIQDNDISLQPQDRASATTYPNRRTPEDSEIDPNESLLVLYNKIRACDPESFPAFFYLDGQKVCVRLWRPDKKRDEHPETV